MDSLILEPWTTEPGISQETLLESTLERAIDLYSTRGNSTDLCFMSTRGSQVHRYIWEDGQGKASGDISIYNPWGGQQ